MINVSPVFKRIKSFTLKRGLTVIAYNNPDATELDIDAIIGVGSIDDPSKEKSGISHLLEHLFLPKEQIDEKDELYDFYIDCYDDINASINYQYTNIGCTVPAQYAKHAIKYFKDILMKPESTEERLKHEKRIILREIREKDRESNEDYEDKIFKAMLNSSLGDDFYKMNIKGTEESVKNITISDVNNHLKKYSPKNTVLILEGNLNSICALPQDKNGVIDKEDLQDRLIAVLEGMFSDWKGMEKESLPKAQYIWNPETIINKTDDNETFILMAWNINNNENDVIINMACSMVYMYIQLLREDKEYVYSASMDEYSFNSNKYIIIKALVDNENLNETLCILKGIKDLTIDENSFKKMKRRKILKYSMGTSNVEDIIFDMARCKISSKEYLDPLAKAKIYENIEIEDIRRYISESFSNPKIFLEGNIEEKDIV